MKRIAVFIAIAITAGCACALEPRAGRDVLA
jgi:hypothetical protein